LRRESERLPAVAEPRGPTNRRPAHAADHDRDRPVHRLRRELHPAEARVLAVEARVVLGPQLAHDRDRLVAERAALGEDVAHRPDLLLDRAYPHAQDQPPAAQHVERRGRLREANRVVVRQHEHGRPETNPRRPRRHEAQERQRLLVRSPADPGGHVRPVEHVIVHPHGVEAQLLGAHRQVNQRVHIVDPPVVEQREPDLHGATPGRPHAAGRSRSRRAISARTIGISSRPYSTVSFRGSKPRIRSVVTPSSQESNSDPATCSGVPTSAVVLPAPPTAAAVGGPTRLSWPSASRAKSTRRRAPTASGRGSVRSPCFSCTRARMPRALSQAWGSVGAMIGRSDTLNRGARPKGSAAARTSAMRCLMAASGSPQSMYTSEWRDPIWWAASDAPPKYSRTFRFW